MKLLTWFLLLASMAIPQDHATYRVMPPDPGPGRAFVGYVMPDPKYTPGAPTDLSLAEICSRKWGKDERKVTPKMKAQVCLLYSAEDCPKAEKWEIDHLISRELGGADDVKNLWPQPGPQFHTKDVIENWLHRQVCSVPPKMSLADAQKGIAADWTQYIHAANGK